MSIEKVEPKAVHKINSVGLRHARGSQASGVQALVRAVEVLAEEVEEIQRTVNEVIDRLEEG